MDATPSLLHKLLSDAMTRKGWKATHLQAALAERGTNVTLSAVCYWLDGGGIADKHRAAVADALGVSVSSLTLAAAGIGPDDPALAAG